ncbi:ribulose-phosphate 3-epimerase [Peptostreptococcus anaerobius]|uniref:Ribulose-phosphate 3-epimerase n=1 Tax=Peptostreptococcus porci TaxID=2652282 RepID=A0A6N7XHN8_9FIRM|nr:ribulose-phosphate 3-epimerase [Peptostreptococcus porci]MDY2794451.1 ribulose-phosphate 3-epimerase [Peptostreptococcus porci]MDY6231993.1 ribulose-phosphate 3-epimerase [Peptostreptococcus porci]MST63133.1 ribulose-phosphate 3-epimerase [Peptostreptococcus porci]
MKLAPSVLSADFANLLNSCKKVENAGCEYLHLDVMDGHFVPNITFGAPIIKSLRKDIKMVFDAHLMITDPDKFIPDLVDAGCDIITVHQEACTHLHRTIQNIKSYNVKAGVVLNPATPVETIKHILPDVDMVLLMSVNPGFGGQKFIPEVLEKVKTLRKMIDERGLDIEIEVDGGVNSQNIKSLVDAGADVLVAGSAIFNNEDIDLAVMNLRNAVKGK